MFGCPTNVTAVTTSRADHIPGSDTLAATVRYDGGAIGTVAVTYAGTVGQFDLQITGTEGRVALRRKFGEGTSGYAMVDARGIETDYPFGGIEEEFARFADACAGGDEDSGGAVDVLSPVEALRDIALVEAIMESGRAGGEPRAVAQF